MEIRETYAAWAARIFEQNPDADIKATFRVGGCVGAHAYNDGALIEAYPKWLIEGYCTLSPKPDEAA